ncbi:hypothetical protein BC829DRAFT_242905 [Chytridium lagenaria]|nr:hypothetical protein BC829DRAFT_242905 [Chytridium lagenaria]
MRWRNTFTSLAVTALSLVFVAVVEAQQKSFAVVFENSNLADVLAQGFTALAVKGCEQAAAENPGYVCKYIFKPASATTADALTTHINNEITKDTTIVHTIFMGFALVTISKRIAELQPSLTVSIMDASIDGSLKNYQGILFPEDEPGFLAGVIAGSVTTSNVVGVIGGNPVPPVQRLGKFPQWRQIC